MFIKGSIKNYKTMSTIIGRVIDEQLEKPVTQAAVKIITTTPDENDQNIQITNNRGEFLWKELNPGAYKIEISADTYSTKEYGLNIQPKSAYEVLVKLSMS